MSSNPEKLIILLTLFSITTIILLIVLLTKEPKETKESKDPPNKKYLFFIRSNDAMTVSVKKEELDSNQLLYQHSGKYTITLPVTSKFSAFTDIPYHESHDLGDMIMADVLFNNNIENIPDQIGNMTVDREKEIVNLDEKVDMLKNHIKNSNRKPFISLEPNCTLSFTKKSSEDINSVNHVNTIAKMTKMKFNTENGTVDLSIEILDGNMLIPVGIYEYCSITVDDWLDDLLDAIGVAAAVVGTAVTCVGTLGVGCAAGVVGVAATIATVST